MAKYTYMDEAGHIIEVQHGMTEEPEITCACGLRMWRMPSHISHVSWGGLKPSSAESISPVMSEFLDNENIAKRRDEYERNKNG